MPSSEDLHDELQDVPTSLPSKVLESVKSQTAMERSASQSSNSDNTDIEDIEPEIPQRPARMTRFASSVRSDFDGAPQLSRGLQQLRFDDDLINDGIANEDGPAPTGYSRSGTNGTGSRNTSGSHGNSPITSQYNQYSAPTSPYVAPPTRKREGSASSQPGAIDTNVPTISNPTTAASRLQRPTVARTPSNAYAPPRRPSQFLKGSHRSSSQGRRRRNPDADYQAQKKAYVQRLKQDNAVDEENMLVEEGYSSNQIYTSEDDSEGDNSATADYMSNDPYDQEAMVYLGNDDMSPSAEELKVPANRERLEWHSMLSNVLTGDVVKQEKKRMTGPTEQATDAAVRYDLWVGVRAKTVGRPVVTHKRMLDDQRSRAGQVVEDIIAFEIKGEAEAGKTPADQVNDIIRTIEKLEAIYPNTTALEAAHARAASDEFKNTCAAVISWQNTMTMINTELGILQNWVGNDRMEFAAPREKKEHESHLTDDSSFLDRILKEDGLKSIGSEHSLLVGVADVIAKAKETMIANAKAYASKHLPSYIEELLTLIAFPSRLVQEIIRIRLQYAERIKDPTQQGVLMAETMLPQFRILFTLAVKVKEKYLEVSQPEPGWDLPPCIDENFDQVVLNAIQFYFKMLTWQMSAGKNTFKEAEILEQEWGFLNAQAQSFDGGDVEVAVQFRYGVRGKYGMVC
jgi:mitogen-activated protein kinase kinase kinase